MQRYGRFLLKALVVFLPIHAFSVLPGTNQPLPNFDNRNIPALEQSSVSNEQTTAVAALRASVPNAQVDFATVTRAPKLVSARDGFLSGPGGNGKGISAPTLAAVPTNDPNRVTKAFLNEHRALFGHGAEALDQARVQRDFVTPHNGMRTVVWQQQVDGIPVFEALLISHVTRNDELVNIGSQFVPDPNLAATHGTPNRALLVAAPTITAQAAVAISARNVGENAAIGQVTASGTAADSPEKNQDFTAPFLNGEAQAKLIWLPMDRDTLRLCWDVTLVSHARGEMYRVLVDAETGAVQIRNCLTNYLQDASYRVFTSDSPSPFSPGLSTPGTTQPPLIPRTLVTTPGLDLTASPAGWINDGGNETLGNNVDAHTDINNDNLPDLPRPQGSPFRVFDFPMDLTTQNPAAYTQASVVQLFYWNNFMHDKLYELGFTEAAGNFQSNNFGRGGFGNDAVQADAQDGGGFNNANFSTPADGSPGRMQMYIFNGPTPQRDGDLDAEVVLHEYTHGLSNRRVGGGVGISALQPSGMGEGWSDFYALSLLSEDGDDVNGVYAAGGYATYQLSGMTQNYYFGIRRYPYCTDMTKNPLTFKDIDPAQASAHSGIPISPIIGTTANEVHNMGEVWCVTLWDVRANLINAHGWTVGNQLMLQLVTDGMNLSPANPTFLQARDAILQAEQVDTGGTNRALLWAGFAKRGMGASATSPSSSTTSGLVEAYDVPDTLQINPTVLSATGPVGGPFTPNPATFTLSNSGTNSLTWVLANTNNWITLSPASGTLSGSSGTNVSVTISATATNFPLGTTTATIWFTNQTSGVFQSRTFSLSVVGRSLFENFEPGIHSSLWSSFGGTVGTTVIANSNGGSVSGVNSLWFGDAGSRFAATIPVDTSSGGSISFYLHLANGPSAPWETVDIPAEGIVLEYSINSGASWTVMGTYDTPTYYAWTQVTTNIPAGAISPATQFRWRQLSHSGTCCDHWALDDISIDAGPTPPSILTQPASQTVKSGTNVTFTVSVQGSFPLTYQWSKDGTVLVDGGRISGSTSASLTISTVLESDSGQYSVLVTNVYGPATSSAATLLVTPLDHFEWNTISSPQAVGVPFLVTITAKDPFNATVTNFSGQVGFSALGGGSGVSQLVTFDDLGTTVPAGYFGLTWSNFNSLAGSSSPNSGYASGTVSAPNVIYNSGASPASILSTGLVNFASAYLTAAWNDNLQVQAQGYNGSTLLYNNTYTLSATAPTLINFHYAGVTRIDFVSFGGTPHPGYSGTQVDDSGYTGSGAHFAMDNVSLGGGQTISITPTNSTAFTNGVWTGYVTVMQAATNVNLASDDSLGHRGISSTFDVLLQNDLSISMTNSPNTVAVGANLTYSLTVANTGPTAATGVTVMNTLPSGVTFVSATASQGSCSQAGGVVTCNLGTIAGAANATVSIVVIPTAAATLTNSATVARAEIDPDPSNNSATSVANALTPTLTISDTSATEGNSGSNNMTFSVQLSPASPSTVTVNFATADGTALAGSDYLATNGTLTFLPGQTNRQISVAVIGDTNVESNETLFMNLSTPANAIIGDAQGLGVILEDDIITVSVFNNPLYVDITSGGVSAEGINVQASLTNLGFLVTTFTNIPGAATSNRVLLFPEFEVRSLAPDLSPAERAALTNFVANGGLLIIHGQGVNAGAFINTVFGLAVVESGQSAGGTVYTRTAATTGTQFAKDPITITGNNGQITLAIANLPLGTLSMYENGNQSAVCEMPYGNGRITFIGWDWYNAVPIGTQDGGWLSVLQSAVLELSSLTPTPPSIQTQPLSQVAKPGTSATFSVSATGSFPLIYQWRKNGTNITDDIRTSGTATAMLTLSSLVESDSGNYSVFVTNANGSATSSNAVLVVTPLDHFNWSAISSPQFAGTPINVTLTAVDSFNAVVTTFNGTVSFSATTGISNTVPVTPLGSGNFTNGIWSGTLAVTSPASGVIVTAQDATAHSGSSNPFDVVTMNDLALTITDSPDPVAVGANLVYTLTVTNSGPSAATGVIITNTLPAGATFSSATASQGTVTQTSGVVIGNLGTIPGAASATVTIVVVPNTAGTLTNRATVSRAEVDPDPSNNSATAITSVLMPTLTIADASLPEGNSGTNNLTFTVQLSIASPNTVTVNFATADGTAQAGSDYLATNGILTFLPGQTIRQISVGIIGDTNAEPTEAFFVNLSAPANAIIGDGQALGTILDDDIIVVSVFNNPLYVDVTSGGVGAEGINVQASLTNLGFLVTTFTNIPGAASSNRVLLFPEFELRSLAPDLTAADRAALSNFVAGGGLLIIHGQGANAGAFINTAFGLAVVESGQTAGGTVYTRTPDALGTQFGDDPLTITGNNGQITLATASLPAGSLNIYTNLNQSVVAEMPYGGGRIIFLGWDWFDAVPIGSQNNGWLPVLQSAVQELSSLTPTPPAILTQPLSQVAKPGTNASFTVSARGSYPLIYHWQKNGTNLTDDLRITGTATPALSISSLVESESGQYSVVITNAYGSTTSSNATLLVTPLDHFNWSAIGSPQFAGAPINVILTAVDTFNATVTNFNGSVSFRGVAGTNTIPVSPLSSGNFTNGTWSGTVAVGLPASGIVLTAQDATAHSGSSNPFDAVATNDLALTMIDVPDPVSVGANLVYTLTVTNSGPAAATGVLVTNTLPLSATFVSATASQGTAVQANGVVVGNLGTIAGGTYASISIVVVPTNSGVVLTNTATIFRNEPDALPGNNTATVVTTVTPPVISIGDASVIEGNVGSVTMVFPVTLSAPSAQTVLVNFATANGTAVAGSDYTGTSGSLVFPPGVTNLEIDVTVLSDVTIESDEIFFVNLSSPVNAIITDTQGAGTIVNDDGLPGQIYSFTWDPIGSPQIVNQPFATTITARDAASAVVTSFNGTVFISGSLGTGATNTILGSPDQTSSGTGDYTVGYSFTPSTNVTVTYVRHYFGNKVSIWTDDGNLIAAQNVTSVPGKWRQTRLDAPVLLTNGVTYRLTVHVPSGTNYGRGDLGTNFPNGTIVKSYDAIGDTFPTQEDPVRWYLVDMQYTVGFAPVTPLVSGNFTNGVWSGNMAVQTFATNFVLSADDGDGHTGSSNPFHVVTTNQPPIILTSPTNTSAFLGGVATLQVLTLGTAPLSYQWRFNGADIAGATNSTLTLNRVLLPQAGGYSVLVSNAFGSAGSGKATLTIVQMVAWGAGTNTVLALPNYMQSRVPPGLTNITRAAGGTYHSIAAGTDGKVYAWGAGTNNTLQNPNYGQSSVPAIGNVVAVAGGGDHTLALRSDGTVAAWGAGTTNTFITPNFGQSIVPPAASNGVAIAAGDYHSVVLRSDGKVIVWGNNSFSVTNVPLAATNVVAIASRGTHVIAMRADGVIVHWGSQTLLPAPTTNYVAIAAGVNHGLALRNDGTVVSFGSVASPPFGLSNVVDIAAGLDHSVALKSDGTVVTWGATNTFGRDQIPPGLSNVVGIACGNYNSMAYLGDGSPVIKYQPVSRSVQFSFSTSFSVFAVGQQLHYQWQRNGTNVPGATNFSITLAAQAFNVGTYRAIITNSFGSVTSSVVSLTVVTTLSTALDTPGNQLWTTSGSNVWFGEVSISHDGQDAAQSGAITDNQQSTLQTTFTGPGSLHFWWKVSSEQFFDPLGFYIDGVQQTNISGEVNWQEQTWRIGSGVHTVKWTYQKDSSGSSGLDAGWLDQVAFTPDPPVFTLQPVGQTNVGGATISLNVAATGVAPISFQWFKFGTNPVGGNSANLTINTATRSDSGIYSAVASNAGGNTSSSNAIVVIRVPQLLKLSQQPDGSFVLISGDADGGLLSSTDITNLQPQASSNLLDWVPMTNSLLLTNGTLLLTDPDATNHPARYYRIIER